MTEHDPKAQADPYADNPELEFAPTQAMQAIPGPDGNPILTDFDGVTAPGQTVPSPAQGLAPGQPGMAPGQPGMAPGQQGMAPGQQGMAPGQQGMAPGQQGMAPGQQGVAPGQQGVAPGQQGVAPGQQGVAPRPNPHMAQTKPRVQASKNPRRIGPSAIISLLGGVALLVSFFMPIYSGAYFTEELTDEASWLSPRYLFEDDDVVPANKREEVRVTRLLFETIGFEEVYTALNKAESKEEAETILKEYGISNYQAMRLFQVFDFESGSLDVDKEARAGGRVIWMSFMWIALSGLVLVLMALIRGLKPMNALQVAWAGTFGLLWILSGIGMLLVEETKKVGGVSLEPFQSTGVIVFLIAGALTWISAWAGLSSSNWWKAPLLGLLLLIVWAASSIGPAMLILA